MKLLAIVVVAVGCSKGGDDCQRLLDKMWPILGEMAKGDIDAQKDKFLTECRKDGKMKNDPMMKCVLDASGDDAVKACMKKSFEDYGTKAKATEAKLMLRKLQKNAQVYFVTNATFFKGKTGPSPAKACCEQAGGKCAVEASLWTSDPVWSALDFQIDIAHLFQYSYESDGLTVKATAVGDPSCGGQPVTYTLEGKVENGNPVFTTTGP